MHARRPMSSMDSRHPEDARTIVAAYAELLSAQTESGVYPAPRTDLPYSRDAIKTAIQTSVVALAGVNQLTSELYDFLEIAYVSLADYVDDEIVTLLREYRLAAEALARDTRQAHEKTGSPAWQTLSDAGPLAARIVREIADDAEELRRDFRQFAAAYANGLSPR